jgi:hypothetical protein
MNYANIPDDVLDLPVGESYENGEYTLRYLLDYYKEDLIHAEWDTVKHDGSVIGMRYLNAWSKDHIFVLTHSMFGDWYLVAVRRNP